MKSYSRERVRSSSSPYTLCASINRSRYVCMYARIADNFSCPLYVLVTHKLLYGLLPIFEMFSILLILLNIKSVHSHIHTYMHAHIYLIHTYIHAHIYNTYIHTYIHSILQPGLVDFKNRKSQIIFSTTYILYIQHDNDVILGPYRVRITCHTWDQHGKKYIATSYPSEIP